MLHRAVLASLVATISALPAAASAESPQKTEVRLSVVGGAGIAATDPCGYINPDCGQPRLRVTGASPMVLVGLRKNVALRNGLQLRLGGVASSFYIAGEGGDSASTFTGAGEIGLGKNGWGFDMIAGVSKIRVEDDQMRDSGYSTSFGFSLSVPVAERWTLVGRADLHAAMHAAIGSAFIGGGIEWTPRM